MNVKQMLEDEFDQMIKACCIPDASPQQIGDMKRAYAGGALVAMKAIGNQKAMWQVAMFAHESGLIDRMPNIPDRN